MRCHAVNGHRGFPLRVWNRFSKLAVALAAAAALSGACMPAAPPSGGANPTAVANAEPYVIGFTSDFSSNFGRAAWRRSSVRPVRRFFSTFVTAV